MADKVSKAKRSEIMSSIRSCNTGLEVGFLKKLSAELYPRGYRYRKHYKTLPGKPDIVFVKHRVAVFLDGDFWHGYNLKKLGRKVPEKYWRLKIERNMARDKKHSAALRKAGWKVLRFWEHEAQKRPYALIGQVEETLKSQR